MSDEIPESSYVVPRIIGICLCDIGRQMKSIFRYTIDGAHNRVVSNLPFFGMIVHELLETHTEEVKATAQRSAIGKNDVY